MSLVKLLIATAFIVCVSVVVLLADISFGRSRQGQQQEGNLVHLLRANFEIYSIYPDDPIAQANISCSARNWGVTSDWGDGTAPEMLSHAVPTDPHAPTPPGAYPVYSMHKYVQRGTYDASFEILAGCSGTGGTIKGRESYRTEVFDHVPVMKFVSESAVVRRGAPVVLTLELVTDAPKSGTRVAFQTDAPGIFQPGAVPRIVTIPQTLTTLPSVSLH